MNDTGIIQATVIGDFAYGLITSNKTMTAEWLLTAVKAASIDWCYDEEMTVNIANRLNKLGSLEDENLEEYNERLNNDLNLTALLEQASPIEVKDIGQIRELPEKPPKLLGRDEDLAKLMASIECDSPFCDILVRGMGGVGKTVICRSLAYRCNDSEKINDILWINAHNGLAPFLRAVVAPAYEIDV